MCRVNPRIMYTASDAQAARANSEGMAVTIVSPRDRRAFSRVESTLKIKIPLEDLIPGADTGRSDRNSGDRRQNKERNTHRRGQKGKTEGINHHRTLSAIRPMANLQYPTRQRATTEPTIKKKPRNRRYKPRRRPSDGNNRSSKDA